MTVRSLSLDKEVVTKKWSCVDCILNKINNETFLNSTNNGIMIKLGKKMDSSPWDVETPSKQYFEMVIRS